MKRYQTIDIIDRIINGIGNVVCWLNGLLVIVIILQVTLRYLFSNGQTWLEELQWHLYGAAVMFGLSYALTNDSHVRVDVLYSGFSKRKKHLIEILTITVFVLPFAFVMFDHSLPFVADAWRVGETSDSQGGLAYRFIIKSVIPISFALLIIAALSRLVRETQLLFKGS